MSDFSQSGELVTVPAGAGYLGTPPTVLVSQIIPSGVQAVIESITCRALDVDITQIRFALRRNGASPSLFLSSMQASMFINTATVPMREAMPPGVVDIVAYNLSGTGLPNAGPAVSPLCQAGWYGSMAPVPQPRPERLWFPKKPWKIGLCVLLSILISHYEKSFAQTLVVPGSTSARSALPVACVNPLTFLLESCGGAASTGLTDVQLRATPVPVTIPTPVPVTGTFFQATQPVSGAFFQATQPVSGAFFQATQPVSGTFWQATQPVSGTFFQATQPVSGPLTNTELRTSPVPISGTVSLGTVGFVLKPFDSPSTPVFPKPVSLLVYNDRMREVCRRALCPPNFGGLR